MRLSGHSIATRALRGLCALVAAAVLVVAAIPLASPVQAYKICRWSSCGGFCDGVWSATLGMLSQCGEDHLGRPIFAKQCCRDPGPGGSAGGGKSSKNKGVPAGVTAGFAKELDKAKNKNKADFAKTLGTMKVKPSHCASVCHPCKSKDQWFCTRPGESRAACLKSMKC